MKSIILSVVVISLTIIVVTFSGQLDFESISKQVAKRCSNIIEKNILPPEKNSRMSKQTELAVGDNQATVTAPDDHEPEDSITVDECLPIKIEGFEARETHQDKEVLKQNNTVKTSEKSRRVDNITAAQALKIIKTLQGNSEESEGEDKTDDG